jgi:hypothetical protein
MREERRHGPLALLIAGAVMMIFGGTGIVVAKDRRRWFSTAGHSIAGGCDGRGGMREPGFARRVSR